MALRLTGLNAKYMNQEMHMKKYDVTALGELLIDFTENGKSSQGNPLFEANPGGAPCNVLAMLAKLGHKTAFIGKVGNDFFGERITVAGLLTGQDIIAQLKDEDLGDEILLPCNVLRMGEDVFLDDITLTELKRTLQVQADIVKSSGQDLLNAVLGRRQNE